MNRVAAFFCGGHLLLCTCLVPRGPLQAFRHRCEGRIRQAQIAELGEDLSTGQIAVSQIVAQLVRGLHRELEPIQQLRFGTAMVRDQEVEGSNPFAPTTSQPLKKATSYRVAGDVRSMAPSPM
jgi:hypothetical protein